MYLGMIGAMEEEIEKIKENMKIQKEEKECGFTFYIGLFFEQPIILVKSNEGKVNAAVCAQILIFRYDVDLVINIGVAGSLTDQLKVGDIAISKDTVQWDLDTTALGYELGFTFGLNTIYIPCDQSTCTQIKDQIVDQFHIVCGTILSSDQFVSDDKTKKFLKEHFKNAIAVDMETASISQVCKINQVPFCGIRAISDSTNAMEYREFMEMATLNLYQVLCEFLKKRLV